MMVPLGHRSMLSGVNLAPVSPIRSLTLLLVGMIRQTGLKVVVKSNGLRPGVNTSGRITGSPADTVPAPCSPVLSPLDAGGCPVNLLFGFAKLWSTLQCNTSDSLCDLLKGEGNEESLDCCIGLDVWSKSELGYSFTGDRCCTHRHRIGRRNIRFRNNGYIAGQHI